MTVKPPDGSGAPGEAALAEAHRAIRADSSIQFDMQPFEPPETPAWVRRLGEWLSGFEAPGLPDWLRNITSLFNNVVPGLGYLFWILLAGLVLLALYFIARRLSGWRWRRAGTGSDESWRPAEAPARRLLEEADALADRGLYSEAAHLLLFRSIEDIDSRRPDLIRPALTSRDIAELPAIPTGPRGAFARIAMLVERGLFAQRPLGEGDWRDCRAAYEDFAFAGGWRG